MEFCGGLRAITFDRDRVALMCGVSRVGVATALLGCAAPQVAVSSAQQRDMIKRYGPPGKPDDEPRISLDDNKRAQAIKRFRWHVQQIKAYFNNRKGAGTVGRPQAK